MDWTSIIVAALGAGGLSELLQFFRNRKNSRRISEAEAAIKKVDVLEKIIDNMKQELKRMKEEADGFYTRLAEKDRLYLVLSKEKDTSEQKNIDYKSCLNQCMECKNRDRLLKDGASVEPCPALKKKVELDEKRAAEFEKRKVS